MMGSMHRCSAEIGGRNFRARYSIFATTLQSQIWNSALGRSDQLSHGAEAAACRRRVIFLSELGLQASPGQLYRITRLDGW